MTNNSIFCDRDSEDFGEFLESVGKEQDEVDKALLSEYARRKANFNTIPGRYFDDTQPNKKV